VGCFYQAERRPNITEEEITDFCRGQIARFKIPKYIFFVKEFPMTASGKIQKYKLSEQSVEMCKAKGIEII
jgi:fatty-acyl-CoA synthase